jgi:hypothetical protein
MLCLALLLFVADAVFAQNGPRVVKMTVSPAPPTAPSTTPVPYPLFPHLRDMKPGNAAVFYQRTQSLEWWGSQMRKEINKAIDDTMEKTWQPEQAKKYEWLESVGPLRELDYAARCEVCDWQFLDRIRAEGYWLLVPDIQAMRTLAALNCVRIRSALHRGDYQEAARGVQSGFALAKHVGEGPCIIMYLVGAAVEHITRDELEEWIKRPDAPSLYWALAELPEPLIDSRRPLQGEAIMMDQVVPEIRQALREKKPRPIPLETLRDRIREFEKSGQLRVDFATSVAMAFGIAKTEPRAREFFLKRGLTAEDLEPLPSTQVALMYLLAQEDVRHSEALKLLNLPYWQSRPFFKSLRAADEEARGELGVNRFYGLFSPGYDRIIPIRPRFERSIALLRHIEALRLHAARNNGQWPDTLEDIRDLPLPVDPFTGKAFSYRREENRAILEVFAPPGMAATHDNAVRYELTLRPKKDAN